MKIRTYLNLILVLAMSLHMQNVKGQEREILKGQIIVDSLENSSGIHVVNLTAETGTTSNENGVFRILSKEGDTLFFSSIQYEHSKVVIKGSDFQQILEVSLMRKFNELDEVQLDDIRLTGDIAKDIDLVPKSIYEKLGMPFPKPRRTSLELAIQSAYNGGHLINILNTLNGKKKRLEKANENNELSISVNKGLNLVGKSFFTSQLGIEDNEIINFLFFCADNPQYSRLVNENKLLKLIEFFENKIDSFKALRQLD
ncbi:MAG TPA: hypothetical protein VJ973_02990 [Christiangramia sp.]|nr:hypothetical protein [Christiangramia sp.]